MPMIPRSRDFADDRRRSTVVRPRGTQRYLKLVTPRAADNPRDRFQGGSRSIVPIGRGAGMSRAGGIGSGSIGGGQAAIAKALASPAAVSPDVQAPPAEVFAPEPVTPFLPPAPDTPAYQDAATSAQGGDPEAARFLQGQTDVDPFPASFANSYDPIAAYNENKLKRMLLEGLLG